MWQVPLPLIGWPHWVASWPSQPACLGWLATGPLPCSHPVGGGVARPCHPDRDEKTQATNSNAGRAGFVFSYYCRALFWCRTKASNHAGNFSKPTRMATWHNGTGGPTTPRAPATRWLHLATPVWPRYHTRATPGGADRNTSPTYSPEIHGWDFRWLELLVASYPPSSSHSNSSCHLKSQPCISEEYVGLVFLATGTARIFGVALVSLSLSPPPRW